MTEHILHFSAEAGKGARKARIKEQREAEEQRKYDFHVEKKKAKHRGHSSFGSYILPMRCAGYELRWRYPRVMVGEIADWDKEPDAEDWENEYISEDDIAEDCGCYIDDDGNWVPMDEEMEEALYEARIHQAIIGGLKKKYASGKPGPDPKDQWPEIIADWKKTKNANKPWFHLHIWPNESDPENVEEFRKALRSHGLDFDEIIEEFGQSGIWVESALGYLLDDFVIGELENVLGSITVVDDVPYRDGLPAPVYVKYMKELEEYYLIPQPTS